MRSIHEIPNRQETPMRKQKQLNLQFLLNTLHDDIGGPGSALTTTCISSILKKIRVTSLYLTPAQISFPHLSAKFDKVPRTMGAARCTSESSLNFFPSVVSKPCLALDKTVLRSLARMPTNLTCLSAAKICSMIFISIQRISSLVCHK